MTGHTDTKRHTQPWKTSAKPAVYEALGGSARSKRASGVRCADYGGDGRLSLLGHFVGEGAASERMLEKMFGGDGTDGERRNGSVFWAEVSVCALFGLVGVSVVRRASVDFLVVDLLKSLFFNGIFGDFVGRGDR